MNLGDFNKLSVVRETDIAYLLTDGEYEYFLHKKEALRDYVKGEMIEVFLYVDNLGRPTASTKIPLVTVYTAAFLEVVSVNPELGVFLSYGMIKDLLLSKDDLPLSFNSWPIVGDELFATIKIKKNMMFAKLTSRKLISNFVPPPTELEEGTSYEAIVLFLLVEGLVCFTKQGHEIFVHYNNTRKKYRMGENVSVTIIQKHDNNEYTGTLIQQKEYMIHPDSLTILNYLQNHAGTMRFTDNTSPEEIQAAFHMSKGAFKRALGTLYKSGLVELNPESTKLVHQIPEL
ncbi:MAG: S1-like domain-containing RNA-binding protein [Candidatus Izemoplasmatales bacterium]|jgi:hypothetical protein